MREIGRCGCCATPAHVLSLGDVDCDGRTVGFVDRGGLCWESELERDVAVGAGRVIDGAAEWCDFPVTLERVLLVLEEVAFHNRVLRVPGAGVEPAGTEV